MSQPSNQEQYLLELVNRFRMNPGAEYDLLVNSGDADVDSALNFFGVDLALLQSQLSLLTAAQPLAWSNQLSTSAQTHNQLMIDFDQQSHRLPGEPSLRDRIDAAGSITYTAVAENIFAFSESPFYAHAGFVVDWGATPTGIQDPAGHRNSLINNQYREAGFSIVEEDDPNTSVGPQVVTQHLANRGTGTNEWLLGVAYRDLDDDDFYSVGEGLGGLTVNITGGGFSASVQTGTAGGYQTLVPGQGVYNVEFRQGNTLLDSFSVSVGTESVKQDLFLEVGVAPSSGRGKITGIQFDDLNGNGIQDIGESGLSGRTVFLDTNGNRQLDGTELRTTTDSNGLYIFNNLRAGTYYVAPVISPGREQTSPTSATPLSNEDFQLDSGQSAQLSVLSTDGEDVLTFNQFEVQGAQEILTSISVGLSPSSSYAGLSNPDKLFVYQDSDGDNAPDADEKILEISPNLVGTDGFANVSIAPTTVTGTFFIGALYEGTGLTTGVDGYTIVPKDTADSVGKSWRAIANNAGGFSSATQTSANWLLRANGSGLQAQVVQVSADETVGGVNFGDRATNAILGTPNQDTLEGSNRDDTILGLAGDDLISGFSGNDTLDGGLDNDTVDGNGGDDRLDGADGNDLLSGGSGNDTLYGGFGDDSIFGNRDDDFLFGDEGDDFLRGGDGKDVIRAGAGNDNIAGNGLRDRIFGEAGNDRIAGNQGPDSLNGGTGNDTIRGQGNDDTLTGVDLDSALPGFNEKDVLTGNSGADVFELGNADNPFYVGDGTSGSARITDLDFSEGDIVQLHGSSSNYSLSITNAATLLYYDDGTGNNDLIGIFNKVSISNFSTGFSFV